MRQSSLQPRGLPQVQPSGEREFTLRALFLGLIMCVVLGAANAYLGLKAGMTIAATYPAAVLSMAVLKLFKGSLKEENFARTVGSIGESMAAGAIFTIPAFVIAGVWKLDFSEYPIATALMVLGGILGIFFVTLLRRVMVEDTSLPFPESQAAAEIHKAGRSGAGIAPVLFKAMGVGALVKLLDQFGVFLSSNGFRIPIGTIGEAFKLGVKEPVKAASVGGITSFSAPAVSPAYLSVGYIIGPELGALNFAGSLLAWGLFVPLLVYFLGPSQIGQYTAHIPDQAQAWAALVKDIYGSIVRPIAVGGMLVGTCYTLFNMRKSLVTGIKRGFADIKKSASQTTAVEASEQDLPFKIILLGIVAILVLMVALYLYFTGMVHAALLGALVILIVGFMFAAVSGNLVGMIGSSNNPISGLTLATTVVAALTMVLAGATGTRGVIAVLAVAAVGCISCAVAGEMLQDLKVGHLLKGTPWKMESGNLIGVVVSGAVMFFVIRLLHLGASATGGLGGSALPAPQAGLMATMANAIIGHQMAWPLVFVGIAMGIVLILIKVKSPMLFSVGMYLPIETTFAIFVGGLIRALVDRIGAKRGFDAGQKAKVENAGVLTASGFIAGEAILALILAGATQAFGSFSDLTERVAAQFATVAPFLAIVVGLVLAAYLVFIPLRKAGKAGEAPPPSPVM